MISQQRWPELNAFDSLTRLSGIPICRKSRTAHSRRRVKRAADALLAMGIRANEGTPSK